MGKKWTRMMAGGMALMLLISGCGGSNDSGEDNAASKGEEVYRVGVIQYASHPSLDAAREGFIDRLKSLGLNIEEEFENAQGDTATLKSISQNLASKDLDLILAIATDSAISIASETEETPIVGTAITDYEGAGLVESNGRPGANLTGTTDMNPVEKQIQLIRQLVPGVQTVGLLYSADEPNSLVQIEMAKAELDKLGIAYEERTAASVVDITQVATSLVGKVEAIYVPTDNMIASAMPNLVSITDPAGIITVVGAIAMVDDGGTATFGLDYYALGEAAGEMAYRILAEGEDPAEMPIESLKEEDFAFAYNQESLDACGIVLPDELAALAEDAAA